MSKDTRRVTASAPGGIGNLGPALDVLGCAVVGARDEITVARRDEPGIEVADAGHPDLPRDAARHTAALAAAAVLRRAGAKHGLTLWCRKGLPLSGGQGGSAASAVAGAVAANTLLGNPLGTDALLASWIFYGAIEEILTGWVLGQLPAEEEDVERAVVTVVDVAYAGLAA